MKKTEQMKENRYVSVFHRANMPKDNIIVFDTNVLLNMYFIEDIEYLKKYIYTIEEYMWCPNQVYLEYVKDRKIKLKEITDRIEKLIAFENTIKTYTDNRLKEYEKLPSYYGKIIREQVKCRMQGVEEYIGGVKEELLGIRKRIGTYTYEKNDEIYTLLSNTLFLNKGEGYSEEEIKEIEREGGERYQRQIPPGYMDVEKLDNKYGDYILWRQVIDKAILENKDVILVSNDSKEDWRSSNGLCREELIEEFTQLTRRSLKLITLDELVKITHNVNNMEECIYHLREIDNNNLTYDTSWSKKYPYYESLVNITSNRRGECYLKKGTDDIAYHALDCIRKFLEYRYKEILCSEIYRRRYGMALDILVRKSHLLEKICRINYKADTCFSIFIEMEKKWIPIVLEKDELEPTDEYIGEVVKYILGYMYTEKKLSEDSMKLFEYYFDEIDETLQKKII